MTDNIVKGDPTQVPAVEQGAGAAAAGTPDSPKASAGAQRAKVQIGGREFEVDADLALAIQAQNQAYLEWQQKTAEYVKQLVSSSQVATATRQPASEPSPEKAPDFFEDPEKAISYHLNRALSEFERKLESKIEAVQRKSQEKEFWDSFYAEHKDLAHAKTLVAGVLAAHLPELADLPVSQAKMRLAELARAEIKNIVQPLLQASASGAATTSAARQIVTGSGLPSGAAPASRGAANSSEPTTLSEVLRARRQARMQSRVQ